MSPPLLRILRDLTEEFQRSKPLEIPVYILRAAVNCGQNRKPQCKMRQRSLRSKRRKAALPPVARRIKAFLANSDRNLIQNGQRSLRQQTEVIRAEP